MRSIHDSPIDYLALPPVVRAAPGLLLAAFPLMKLLPAQHIIESALACGRIKANSHVVETSSGNFALGLALVCHRHGLRLTIVGDHAIDPALRCRLELLGTEVILVSAPCPVGGIQRARLMAVEAVLAADPDCFWPAQYDNPQNPEAYERFVDYLLELGLSKIDTFVGAVGSGGSMCGTVAAYRRHRPEVAAVAVDTAGSVLFGQPDRSRALRGLGNSIHPGNHRPELFDEVHWLTAGEAFQGAAQLYSRTGLFMGGTSGAAYLVGDWRHRLRPEETCLVLLPDDGTRYLNEYISWRAAPPCIADAPEEIERGAVCPDHWCFTKWRRNRLAPAVASS